MLKQRILTALVLAPLALLALFVLPQTWFTWVLAAVFIYGGLEWANLCRLSVTGTALLLAAIAGLMWGLNVIPQLAQLSVWLAVVFWCFALVMVLGYPKTATWCQKPQRILFGFLVLVPAWYAMLAIRSDDAGLVMLLMLLMLVWGADIGAYAAGKSFGRNKLLPAVSPGKTREGLWGGLLTCALIGTGFSFWLELSLSSGIKLTVLALLTGMASVLGDLLESMLKRERGIKDSGRLLPGHGGVLDRIDSLTAAAPVFALGLTLV